MGMGGAATSPGPLGVGARRPAIDQGTTALGETPAPAGDDRRLFDHALQALEAEIANVGAHASLDGAARLRYSTQLRAVADELHGNVAAGRMTWKQAAEQAHDLRNSIMDLVRQRSTPVGLAYAQQLKSEGPTLNALVARKTLQLHGPQANFNALSAAQRDAVYAEIVASAGRANPRVSAAMRSLSRAGRGLLVISLALSVYQVAAAEDKAAAAGRELAVSGAGIGGGIAGGALAGLACGPGAPVCVTVGAFVGGALAAFGVDFLW
jgi:hypothetical protein